MAEATTSTVEEQTSNPQDPTGFKAWAAARTKGETPTTEEEETQSAAAEQGKGSDAGPVPPAKTAPDSETDTNQETEPGDGETPEETAEQRKLRSSSRQRRIDRLTKENEELTRRLEAASKPTAAPPATEKPTAPPDPNRPKPLLKDFKTLEEYNESLTDWKLDQREAARKAEAETQARADAVKSEQDGWQKKQSAAAKEHADYYETIEAVKAPTGPGTLAMRQALMEEDSGALILYHLAKHPEELARITACMPAKAAVEIGKLAASLETPNPGTNGKPKISGAPPPPSRLSRSSGTQTDSVDDPVVQRDWKRWAKAREAQLKGR